MKIIDPGHVYELRHLDDDECTELRFVKREGEKYPGNAGHHGGVTTQEVLRALIERMLYVNGQQEHVENVEVVSFLRQSLMLLEQRAAKSAGYALDLRGLAHLHSECLPVCRRCGHVGCQRIACAP